MAISRWFWRSGFGPKPSAGPTAWEKGRGLEAVQDRAAASVHTSKGLATVAMSPKKNTPTAPITAKAPQSSESGSAPPAVARRHSA